MDNLKDLPRFMERSMPMFMHFEICEALRKVLSDTHPTKVLEFEKTKLTELDNFVQ